MVKINAHEIKIRCFISIYEDRDKNITTYIYNNAYITRYNYDQIFKNIEILIYLKNLNQSAIPMPQAMKMCLQRRKV